MPLQVATDLAARNDDEPRASRIKHDHMPGGRTVFEMQTLLLAMDSDIHWVGRMPGQTLMARIDIESAEIRILSYHWHHALKFMLFR